MGHLGIKKYGFQRNTDTLKTIYFPAVLSVLAIDFNKAACIYCTSSTAFTAAEPASAV